jgi:membrane-associated progesterone receptor component
VALRGVVYDVSSSRSMYGRGAGYHCFAGRESTRAMAKFSFEEKDLADPYSEEGFGMFERNTLDEWVMKFEFKYPRVGRVTEPPRDLEFTKADLAHFRRPESETAGEGESKGENTEVAKSAAVQAVLDAAKGRVDRPLLIGVNGKVLDVGYGGTSFYGGSGPYSIFAGRDITRALATMSLKPEDVDASDACPLDKVLEGLSDKEVKIMRDWETKFIEKRKYPVVGRLVETGLM